MAMGQQLNNVEDGSAHFWFLVLQIAEISGQQMTNTLNYRPTARIADASDTNVSRVKNKDTEKIIRKSRKSIRLSS